jgi:DNA (cytosine-5)-methyltransferase 1
MALRIGTDCSGIEAPIEALRQLKIPFRHLWSCEIDRFARQSIMANYPPEIMYEDIAKRNHSSLPDIDMYVCGFPCQPFSLMGRKEGTADPRSNIMSHCIEVIQKKKPKIFILENVKNFKFIQNGEPFKFLIDQLESIGVYNIYSDIYNTKDYGIPQNRERIYIIGILKEYQKKEFVKPKSKKMKDLDSFIIDKTTLSKQKLSKSLSINIEKTNPDYDEYIIHPFTYYFPIKDICPTLTTQCHCFYHKKYKRNLIPLECLLLQGFKKNFNQVVSNTQMFKQVGNSMSVNVVKGIIKSVLLCIN